MIPFKVEEFGLREPGRLEQRLSHRDGYSITMGWNVHERGLQFVLSLHCEYCDVPLMSFWSYDGCPYELLESGDAVKYRRLVSRCHCLPEQCGRFSYQPMRHENSVQVLHNVYPEHTNPLETTRRLVGRFLENHGYQLFAGENPYAAVVGEIEERRRLLSLVEEQFPLACEERNSGRYVPMFRGSTDE